MVVDLHVFYYGQHRFRYGIMGKRRKRRRHVVLKVAVNSVQRKIKFQRSLCRSNCVNELCLMLVG